MVLRVASMLVGLLAIVSAWGADLESEGPEGEQQGLATGDPGAPVEAVERETQAQSDPLAERQAEQVEKPKVWAEEPSSGDVYGSLRVRYRRTDDAGEGVWGDAGSRAGLAGRWQFRPRSWLFGRAEAGFNLLDGLDRVLNPEGRSKEERGAGAFLRLLYGGVELPNALVTVGKNWSPYYQVSSFTDRFQGLGGQAVGTYNARTDGGRTGTGRADGALQTRFLIDFLPKQVPLKPFHLNVQLQHGNAIPTVAGEHYGIAFGLSALLKTRDDFALGVAYNRAEVPNPSDPTLRAAGIEGSAQAFLAGGRWFQDDWYLGATLARLENHEATNDDIYFNGWGGEVYGQYRIWRRLWAIGGWNQLEPDGDEADAGSYRIKYGVLGLRYTFDDFRRFVYLNVRVDDSRDADGSKIGNVYTIGVRWDFDWRVIARQR
jgi:predicted porin